MGDILAIALGNLARFFHCITGRISFGAVFLLLWLGMVVVVFLAVVALTHLAVHPAGVNAASVIAATATLAGGTVRVCAAFTAYPD